MLVINCLSFHFREPPNSEADTLIIAKAREPICACSIIETTKPPTYLFSKLSMSKSERQKQTGSAYLKRDPPVQPLIFVSVRFSRFRLARPAPRCGVCRFGEGRFTDTD